MPCRWVIGCFLRTISETWKRCAFRDKLNWNTTRCVSQQWWNHDPKDNWRICGNSHICWRRNAICTIWFVFLYMCVCVSEGFSIAVHRDPLGDRIMGDLYFVWNFSILKWRHGKMEKNTITFIYFYFGGGGKRLHYKDLG